MLHQAREFFALREPERLVGAYAPEQYAEVRHHFDAAERRRNAALSLASAVPAAVLLCEATREYLVAIDAARDAGSRLERGFDAAAALPPVPPDPIRADARPTSDQLVRAALASHDPLHVDRLPADEAELLRRALERTTAILRRGVEVRSLAHLRASRWGRQAAAAIVATYVAFAGIRAAFVPTDIALGKPVHSSSRKHNPPDGHELVDGVVGGGFALHTNTEDSPNAVIDLTQSYFLDRVAVYNRTDGWFDDCLPLVVEVSADGAVYREIGRRTVPFGTNPPWVVEGRRLVARYVRVRVDRRSSYLALSEVKVYGEEKKP
jgi:hypothetical protein